MKHKFLIEGWNFSKDAFMFWIKQKFNDYFTYKLVENVVDYTLTAATPRDLKKFLMMMIPEVKEDELEMFIMRAEVLDGEAVYKRS